MANQEHLDVLKQGVEVWNQWRQKHPEIQPDFRQAELNNINLDKADLSHANFNNANLKGATLCEANLRSSSFNDAYLSNANIRNANLVAAYICDTNLIWADLSYSDLSNAYLYEANLSNTTLTGVNLTGANLRGVNLSNSDLSNANVQGADLYGARLVGTNLSGADLSNCLVYGISVWNVQLQGAKQENLVIADGRQPTITLDNLEVAQFIYLLLNNKKIREVIDTITSKVVLILGRFTSERKAVLDAIRDELRKQDYVPVLFDFDEPTSRDVTETVTTLARMARFIIADITDPRSIPQELALIVPNLPSVPVQPLLCSPHSEYGMFTFFTKFPWVLPIYHYADQTSLLQSLRENVIAPAEKKAKELTQR